MGFLATHAYATSELPVPDGIRAMENLVEGVRQGDDVLR